MKVAFSLMDFRPISLLGYGYKLLVKVLAVRLSGVVNKIIFPSQLYFIKGRNLVNGVLVVNEVVDLTNKTRCILLVLKVDLEKAYDSVD